MKNTVTKNIMKVLFTFFLFASIMGCGEMLDNPTIDKDTGEDVTLLLVDFNFFTTRASYKIIDAEDNSIITKPAKVWFTGKNANDIVNYAGEKNAEYNSSQGQMELTVDPNLKISSSSPMEYAVHVEIEGYHVFSQGIQINSTGQKTFELLLTKKSSGDETTYTGQEDGDSFVFMIPRENIKSAQMTASPDTIGYRITKADLLKFKHNGQLIFKSTEELMDAYNANKTGFLVAVGKSNRTQVPAIDLLYIDGTAKMYSTVQLEIGTFMGLSLNNVNVDDLNGGVISQTAIYRESPEPNIFGFIDFQDGGSLVQKTIAHNKLNFTYRLIQGSYDGVCATGSSIKFMSNAISSFSFDAEIQDANGTKLKSVTFKGKFNDVFTLDNIPATAGKLVFKDNNPSFKAIPKVDIPNLCSGNIEIDISAADGYEQYQVVLKALCTENSSIAIAPTYSGQIRITGNKTDYWQGIEMVGGVADMLAKPNQEYDLRLLWEDEWEYFDFGTHFEANGDYIKTTTTVDKITSKKMTDGTGRIQLNIEHTFKQSICDDMGW